MIALLAGVMFVSHAVAAEGTLLHAHDHTMAQAVAPYVAEVALDGPDRSHDHSTVTNHQHDGSQDGKLSCCGDACLLALMPDGDLDLEDPWATPSKTFTFVFSLAGHDPEGLRRPPRLSHRI
ncbi:hypothetical protein [Paracoccus aerius]|uniref:DUF2946 domain-containing protein n=1 Tax=Paracoccus aerius TaxID=1915382 RepID=A0ABS1SA12_9RHOB|nr:hypothetical protein [Paracoccus aerius]MBL3675573.1 hypothetical protein [Paracoccus aerius]